MALEADFCWLAKKMSNFQNPQFQSSLLTQFDKKRVLLDKQLLAFSLKFGTKKNRFAFLQFFFAIWLLSMGVVANDNRKFDNCCAKKATYYYGENPRKFIRTLPIRTKSKN